MRLLDRFLTTNELDAPVSAIVVMLGLFAFILVFDLRGGFDGQPGAPGTPGAVVTTTSIVQEHARRAGSVSVSRTSPAPRRPISTRTHEASQPSSTTTPDPVVTVRPRPRPTLPTATPRTTPTPVETTAEPSNTATPVTPEPSQAAS